MILILNERTEPDSPEYVLDRPDYYCLYPITVVTARTRA